eukprot:1161800-Pelagomonas_calceolata.AAC.1
MLNAYRRSRQASANVIGAGAEKVIHEKGIASNRESSTSRSKVYGAHIARHPLEAFIRRRSRSVRNTTIPYRIDVTGGKS